MTLPGLVFFFALAGMGGRVVNAVASSVWPERPIIMGSPTWNWRSGLVFQFCIFPLAALTAFAANAEDKPSIIFSFIITTYMLKDFFVDLSPVFVLHHIVCIGAAVAFLFFKDGGYNAFMLGTMCLEIGSGSQTALFVFGKLDGRGKPNSTTNALGTFHLVAMSASNALAVFVFAPWMWTSAAKNSEGVPSLLAATFSRWCHCYTMLNKAKLRARQHGKSEEGEDLLAMALRCVIIHNNVCFALVYLE